MAVVAQGAVSCLLGDWKKWQDTGASMQLLDTLLGLSGLSAATVSECSSLVILMRSVVCVVGCPVLSMVNTAHCVCQPKQ